MAKEQTLYLYTVSGEGRVISVPAVDMGQAIQRAAEAWGEDWRWLAGFCVAHRGGKARKPTCRACGREFGKAGDPAGRCPVCQQIQASTRRMIAQIKGPDRRARYGG